TVVSDYNYRPKRRRALIPSHLGRCSGWVCSHNMQSPNRRSAVGGNLSRTLFMTKDRHKPAKFRYALSAATLFLCTSGAVLAAEVTSDSAARQRAFEAAKVGAAGLAVDVARSHPHAFSELELLRFEHASIAQRLRWAETEMDQLTGPERSDTLDQALVEGLSLLDRIPRQPEYGTLRRNVTYDMVFGLTMRGRTKEAIALFESLQVPWSEIYPYVLVAAGN